MANNVRRWSELFGVSRANANIPAIAAAACREGYAVLPVAPGTKKPMCTLTPAARKKADREAAAKAKDAGHKGWVNVRHSNSGQCGVHHAITDPAEALKVFKRLLAEHPELNLALEVGRSRMLCVDADNAEDVTRFTAHWAAESGFPALAAVRPTVSSPGVLRNGDQWIHRGGGHFWFDLPAGVDFAGASTATGLNLGGASVYFRDRVLLVPPSVREEGPYTLHSDIGMAPQWLIDAVTLHVEGHALRRERQQQKTRHDGDPIEMWAAETPWAALLEPDGWTQSHKYDGCQCEIWTRPGDWSSPKSATAHEPGCTSWDADDGNGFLHIWTDDPPDCVRGYVEATGSKSLSKLQYVAWRDHAGDYAAAMRALEIGRIVDDPGDPADLIAPGQASADPFDPGDPVAGGEDAGPQPEDRASSWRPVDLSEVLDGTYVPPEATLLRRTDGYGLFYPGRVHWVQGEPESGKSWVAQLATAQVLTAGGRGLYLDYEQDAATIVARLRLLGVADQQIRVGLTYLQPEVSPYGSQEVFDEFTALCREGFELAIVDGVTDALGIDGKSLVDNDEVASWMRRVPRVIARSTGAAVVCVDHVVKDKEGRGRYALGAQAKLAGVDGASYIVEPDEPLAPGARGVLVLRLLKDRYGTVRSACPPWRKADRSQEAARVVFDGTGTDGRIRASVNPPEDDSVQPPQFRPTDVMERISLFLEDLTEPVSTNAVVDGVTGKKETIRHALELLTLGGFTERGNSPGRGGGVGYASLRPYRTAAELIAERDSDDDE